MSAGRPLSTATTPAALAAALGQLAGPAARPLLLAAVNRALAERLADGEVDFLAGRVLEVVITDLGIAWRFTLGRDGDRVIASDAPAEATIRADGLSYLLLASRRVDPDTLFFQRRLLVEGDTELGLWAKNLLDSLELDDLPRPLALALDRAGRLACRLSA